MAHHNNKGMDFSIEEGNSIYNTPNSTLTLEDVVDNNVSGFNANTSFINAETGFHKPSPDVSNASFNSTLYNSDSDQTLNSTNQSVRTNSKRKFDETASEEETEPLSTGDAMSHNGSSSSVSPSPSNEPTTAASTPAQQGQSNPLDNTAVSPKADGDKKEQGKNEGIYDEYLQCYLPKTVTILTAPKNCRVYLVGTVHFSKESHEDVSKVIKAVQPDVVLVELCKSRLSFLELDEEAMLEAVNLSYSTMVDIIKEKGVVNGMLFVLLLSLSARITKVLNMAPGGEFRRALKEAEKVPNCKFVLGDRPLSITVQRVVASLSWCMTLRLWWNLFTSLGQDVSTEDLEKLKHTDLLEELLKELSKDFPDVGNVFVNERDIYIAHHLQMLAKPHLDEKGQEVPTKVVGVIGIGHAPGIAAKMGKVSSDDVRKIMIVPPPSMTSRVIKITIRASLIGVVVYGVTRIVPVHRLLPSANQIKSFVQSALPIPSK